MLVLGLGSPARAYDPVPALRNLYGAPHAVAWILQVKPGRESEFVNAMLNKGPYSKLLSGFASEKLVQLLPVQAQRPVYVSFSRYYDSGTAEFVESERMPAIEPYLEAKPQRLELTLVEHLLSNWGWERGTPEKVVRSEPFKNEELFRTNISSLSFFKSGYVGQIGALEFFDETASLETVRQKVAQRSGLSGASVYTIAGQSRYLVYCEFFRTPPELGKQRIALPPGGLPLGTQIGVVIQNYIPR